MKWKCFESDLTRGRERVGLAGVPVSTTVKWIRYDLGYLFLFCLLVFNECSGKINGALVVSNLKTAMCCFQT